MIINYKELLPGTVGAVFNTYFAHPFDTIRVKMQNINSSYESSFTCFKNTYKNGGTRGIFSGVTLSLYGTIAESSVVFASNEYLKQNFYGVDRKTPLTLYQDMYIGSMSGLLATIVSCPFETIKCNMQIYPNKTSLDISKKYGITGLYKGFNASCMRNIPYYLLFFPIYNNYLHLTSNINGKDIHNMNLWHYSLSGGLAGATTWTLIYPLDVIKCNQQICEKSYITKSNIINTTKKIIKQYGYKGLFRGYVPTIMRAFPGNAGLLFGVEFTQNILDNN